MTSKRHHDHDHDNGQCPDDWAGLAQNLFGINLEKSEGDDDLLDADMFKVELPKPLEPPPPVPASVEEALQVTEIQFAAATAPVAAPAVKAQPRPTTAALKTKVAPKASAGDEPFGFGVISEEADDDGITLAEDFDDEGLTLASDVDEGLTLPPDFDAEGLTLPSDYDDGLTLPPEAEREDESVDVAFSATETLEGLAVDSEAGEAADGTQAASKESDRGGRPRRRPRGREDTFWDLLENWEWQEIPDGDSPRGEGERSRFGRDRRPRQDRGRSEHRGRPGERRPDERGREDRPRVEEHGRPEERPPTSDASSRSRSSAGPRSGEGNRSGDRTRSGDRPRERSRPSGGGDRPRDERPREPSAPATKKAAPPPTEPNQDDFGSGIFAEDLPVKPRITDVSPPQSRTTARDVGLAQSSQAADAVLPETQIAMQPDDQIWSEDDDSDVRLAPAGEILEVNGLPAADLAGESDQTFDDTRDDVVAVDDHHEGLRPRRRRRRRRRGPSDLPPSPDGGEGTMFDIHEVLNEAASETDLVPSAMDADRSLENRLSDETESDGISGDETSETSSERLGRRRRRRRRRPEPSVNRTADIPAGSSQAAISDEDEDEDAEDDSPLNEADAPGDEEELEVATVSYAKIPRWEEAIKYLLNPQLVGRNLDPEDELESLEGDPRGSGGSEPTPPPPRQHRRGGGRRRR